MSQVEQSVNVEFEMNAADNSRKSYRRFPLR